MCAGKASSVGQFQNDPWLCLKDECGGFGWSGVGGSFFRSYPREKVPGDAQCTDLALLHLCIRCPLCRLVRWLRTLRLKDMISSAMCVAASPLVQRPTHAIDNPSGEPWTHPAISAQCLDLPASCSTQDGYPCLEGTRGEIIHIAGRSGALLCACSRPWCFISLRCGIHNGFAR